MKLQVSPNKWSCAATSAAMALDVPLADLIKALGHDGSGKVWQPPHEDEPAGFHIHEIIDAVWLYFSTPVTPFVRNPKVQVRPDAPEQDAIFREGQLHESRFCCRLYNRAGVLTGEAYTPGSVIGHAVAWDGHRIYDPRGYVYNYEDRLKYNYEPDVFWMFGGLDVSTFTIFP